MRKNFSVLVVLCLLLGACGAEGPSDPDAKRSEIRDPAAVWCSAFVECSHPRDPALVLSWCERQFAPTSDKQVSDACLDQIESESCPEFLAGPSGACR